MSAVLVLCVLDIVCWCTACTGYSKLGWDNVACIWKWGVIDSTCITDECAWEGTWGCFTQKRSPKCGILSSKLRSPVCKGRRRRRRWGCGSVRAVSVWPAHVTCLLLRAMAVAKEQVTEATVVAMEQVTMAVVRAVSWCKRWCWWGTFTGIAGKYTEHSSRRCLRFPPPLTVGADPEVCSSTYARV